MPRHLTDGQRLAMVLTFRKCGIESDDERLWVAQKLFRRQLESFNEFEHADWRWLRNLAYPGWPFEEYGAWTLSQDFQNRIAELRRVYAETVRGQLSLIPDAQSA